MKNKNFKITIKILFVLAIIFYSNQVIAENRIISLIPSSTEMLFALGFGEEIVAISNYCNYPKDEIKNLPRIGDQNLNIEKIISLRPTILVDTNSIHKRYENIFNKLRLNYINLSIKKQSDIPKEAYRLANLLNDEKRANKFINNWNQSILKLSSINNNKKKKIYMEIWDSPIQVVGGNNNMNSIIETAGGENVFEKQNDFPIVNSEMVLIADPEIIFLVYPGAKIENIKKRPGWNKIKAVKSDQIYALDQDLFVRPGPRNLDGIKLINNLLNKEAKNE